MRWLTEKTWRKPVTATTVVDADILALPFSAEIQCDLLVSPEQFLLIRQFHQGVLTQLDMLGTFLQSASIVLLWPTATGQLHVYASNQSARQIQAKSFAAGSGLLGALKERAEFALAPYPVSAPTLPYYPDAPLPGSFYACRIASNPTPENPLNRPGIVGDSKL